MTFRKLGLALALACVFVCAPAAVRGQDPAADPKGGDEENQGDFDITAKFTALFKGLDEVTGKVTFNAEDVASFIKNWPLMKKAMKSDKKFQEIKENSIQGAFEYLNKDAKFAAWATEQKLDKEVWLRKSLRVMSTWMKAIGVPKMVGEGREQLEGARKMLASAQTQMPEEQFKKQEEQLAKASKQLDEMGKVINEKVPGPSEDEQKLLEKSGAEIEKIGGDHDDEGDEGDKAGEKGDGKGGSGEKGEEPADGGQPK
ncbi:MAG: hypothetical protein HYZ53_20975 [Planctomycetes bacterium]|nr:hypothetical protein [Planctomycetota bacterium]